MIPLAGVHVPKLSYSMAMNSTTFTGDGIYSEVQVADVSGMEMFSRPLKNFATVSKTRQKLKHSFMLISMHVSQYMY